MKFISLLVLLMFGATESARILGIFPTPSISHQIVFHALMKDLAARGHELTILTTDLIEIQNPNVTQIDLHDSYEIFLKKFNFVEFKDGKNSELDLFKQMYDFMIDFLEEQLSHPEVKRLITERDSQKFDLIIFEHLYYLPWVVFGEIYNAPTIAITSLDAFSLVHESFGNVVNPAIHPEVNHPFKAGMLSFFERWETLKLYLCLKFLVNPAQDKKYEEIIRKHFPMAKSTIDQLKGNIDLLMTNKTQR